MSIITGRGDDGNTDLMYGKRVPKTDPRVAAYGNVDELNASIGLIRVAIRGSEEEKILANVQKQLVVLMGELATAEEDRLRYTGDGFEVVDDKMVESLTTKGKALEKQYQIRFEGWIMPGEHGHAGSAQADHARTVCRRAERLVIGLGENGQLGNPSIPLYLNRLSDLFWILARGLETSGE